jgi:hypothetical protein
MNDESIEFAVTRFNTETWMQYARFTENHETGYYTAPKQITRKTPLHKTIIVLEMNNDSNTIMGIGIVKNYCEPARARIYEDKNFNRYTYKHRAPRIDRSQLNMEECLLLRYFESVCFRGSRHLKRGAGITIMPTRIIEHCLKFVNIFDSFKKMFTRESNTNIKLET